MESEMATNAPLNHGVSISEKGQEGLTFLELLLCAKHNPYIIPVRGMTSEPTLLLLYLWFPNCVPRCPTVPQRTHRGVVGYIKVLQELVALDN